MAQIECLVPSYVVAGCGNSEFNGIYDKTSWDGTHNFYEKRGGGFDIIIEPGIGWPGNTNSIARVRRASGGSYSTDVPGFGCPEIIGGYWQILPPKGGYTIRQPGPSYILPLGDPRIPLPFIPSVTTDLIYNPYADEFEKNIDIDEILDAFY